MQSNRPALFQQMRHNILQTASVNLKKSPFDEAYLFAWLSGVYPIYSQHLNMYEPYEDFFSVNYQCIKELNEFLECLWLNQEYISFWQLEDVFDAHLLELWDRDRLINACRYLYLNDCFDNLFWWEMLRQLTSDSIVNMIRLPLQQEELMLFGETAVAENNFISV